MPAISAVGSPQIAPSSNAAALIAGNTAPASASGASSTSMSSSSSIHSSVNTMLGSIDSGLAGNDLLKMAIAMLILQSMSKGQESGGSGGGNEMLGALMGMMGQSGGGSSSMMMMQSSSISIEQTTSMSQAQGAYAGVNAAAQSGAGLSVSA